MKGDCGHLSGKQNYAYVTVTVFSNIHRMMHRAVSEKLNLNEVPHDSSFQEAATPPVVCFTFLVLHDMFKIPSLYLGIRTYADSSLSICKYGV